MANVMACRLCPQKFESLQQLYDHVEIHAEDEETAVDDETSGGSSRSSSDDDSVESEDDPTSGNPVKNGLARSNDARETQESSEDDSEEETDDSESDEDGPETSSNDGNGGADVAVPRSPNCESATPASHQMPQAGSFPCHMCPRVYRSKYTRNSHMKRDHQVVPLDDKYYCSPCDKIFTRKREFIRHQRQEHTVRKVRRKTANSAAVRKPCATRRDDAGVVKKILAGLLSKTFGEQLSENEGCDVKEEPVDVVCDVCGFEAVTSLGMKSHMYAHVDDLDTESWMRAYAKCGLSLKVNPDSEKNGFGGDDLSVSSDDDEQAGFKRRNFSSSSVNDIHNLQDDDEDMGTSQFGAGRRFRPPNPASHSRTPSSRRLGLLHTPVPVAASSGSTLPSSVIVKPTGEVVRSYPCPDCHMVFPRSSARAVHMNRKHVSSMNFRCGRCAKGFQRRGNLELHMRTCSAGDSSSFTEVCSKSPES